MTLKQIIDKLERHIILVRVVRGIDQFGPEILELKKKEASDFIESVRKEIQSKPMQLAMDWEDRTHGLILTLESIIDDRM